MSFPRNNGGCSSGVSASRSVALDLMLRTFMNSSEFHCSRPRVWEKVSRLVPGTTPQQCYERWEELRSFPGHSVSRDCSELTAYGRPVSHKGLGYHRQTSRGSQAILRSPSLQTSTTSTPPPPLPPPPASDTRALLMPHSQTDASYYLKRGEREKQLVERRESTGGEEGGGWGGGEGRGKEREVEVMRGAGRRLKEEVEERNQNSDLETGSRATESEKRKEINSSPTRESDMIIHVFDDQRKTKRQFHCPRGVLVREMRYFSEYLSSETQMWDEVDISVHCDITVFDWLMRYAKRGLLEGPRGEILDGPLESPTLEPANVVSILISSDFLKMESLVEECLNFCHKNLSAVLASPTNMSCISDKLRERLAGKFTPTELEEVVDKRDKIRSKLFVHQIQQLFSPTHSHPQCLGNAATIFRCRYCWRLLTAEQISLLPCTDSRLEVHYGGQVVWHHERDKEWSVSTYLSSLHRNLSPRDIYWRLWGVVNWLRCSSCGQVFQCRDLASCHYHPQPVISGRSSTGPPVHICCGNPPPNVSPFPLHQSGCCVREHTLADSSLFSLLLSHRDVICSTPSPDPEPAASKRKRDTHPLSPPSSSSSSSSSCSSCPQLNFLKTADLHGARCKVGSGLKTESVGQRGKEGREEGCREVSKEGGAAVREQGSVGNAVAMEMPLLARQRALSELSELEEDEEEEEEERVVRRPQPLPLPAGLANSRLVRRRDSNKQSGRRSNSVRKRHSSAPAVAVDWVWDSSKPQRWNQDHQRDNDERRLDQLCVMLSHNIPATHTLSSSTSIPARLSSRDRDSTQQCSAGGIFCQLEAQFRVQQMSRALSQQPPLAHNSASRFPTRKR